MRDRPVYLGLALPSLRFFLFFALTLSVIAILIGQAFKMQVIQGASFKAQAEDNRLRHDVVQAKRGLIEDRNGVILAENVSSFDLRAIPNLLPQDQNEREELLSKIGLATNVPLDTLNAKIASSTNPTEQVTLVHQLPYAQAINVQVLIGSSPGLQVEMGTKRLYPYSDTITSLSHVLGYVGLISPEELDSPSHGAYHQTDSIGKSGVEKSYEAQLRGTAGERLYEVDATNQVTSLVGETPSKDGTDLHLTIDARLQQAAQESLEARMNQYHLSRGSVVVMDPQDGSILAIASLPAYDNNNFSGTVSSTYYAGLLKNPDHPLLPRAWAGIYPSGSTVKSVVATAALAEGVVTAQTTVNSTGGLHVGGIFFPDWKAGGHGITNVRRAIAWSVNTFFYTVGGGYGSFVGLGVDRLTSWMRKFGLGATTGFDIPGEQAGFVPSKDWKQRTKGESWYVGDTYNLSIGQGDLLVTPLQDALMTAEVANGGHRLRPHVVEVPGVSYASSTPLADSGYVETVREGMRDTVTYGSGRALASFPIPVAGKTGTAQWRSDRPNHAWFTAFAPFDKPEISVTVMLEEGVEGSSTAIPVAHDVLNAWYAERQNPKLPFLASTTTAATAVDSLSTNR